MRVNKNSGMVLIKKYKKLFELAKEFVRRIYIKTPFYFSDTTKLTSHLHYLQENEQIDFLANVAKYFSGTVYYNYFYYLLASYDFTDKGGEIVVKRSKNFNTLDDDIKGEEHIIKCLMKLQELLEAWKSAQEGDEEFGKKEEAVLKEFERLRKVMVTGRYE